MGRRSRKARPGAGRGAGEPVRAAVPHPDRAPGGPEHAAAPHPDRAAGEPDRAAAPQPDRAALRRGYARSRERDDALRAQLAPLGPGERPAALKVAAAVAALLALANVAAMLAGVEVDGQRNSPVGVVVFSGLMLVAAAGMWQRRYWAVLGFQFLLGLAITFFALLALVAANLLALAVSAAVVILGGWLFWKLVRVLGRLQAPARIPRNQVR